MGIATSGPRRQPSHQLLTGSMSPSPARVRVSGTSAAVEANADATAHRRMNVIVAGLALFVAVPLLLLIAVSTKLTSHGAVLYTQERIVLDRRSCVYCVGDP